MDADNHVVEYVSRARWEQAQKVELETWKNMPAQGSDWSEVWAQHFGMYEFLRPHSHRFKRIIEVGCGPWARNMEYVRNVVGDQAERYLLDPLMDQYVSQGKSVAGMDAVRINSTLEEMSLPVKFDLIVCINVLDHVSDVGVCFSRMHQHLEDNGILILGQDLSNAEDYARYPASWDDVAHPIKLDLESCEKHLRFFCKPVCRAILQRGEGRNPQAHYATLIYAGQKG